jgi:hypothetical protein
VVAVLTRPELDADIEADDDSSTTRHTAVAEVAHAVEFRGAGTAIDAAPDPAPAAPTQQPIGHRLRRRAVELATHEARRILIPLAVLTAISSLGTVAAPGLVGSRPLLLVALSPRLSFLAIAAPKTALAPFLLVAGIRLCLADPFHFVLGRRHGSKHLANLANRNRLLRATHRVASHSVLLLVFLRPTGTNLAIAGASHRGHGAQIVAADIVGTIVYLLLIHQLGASFVPH